MPFEEVDYNPFEAQPTTAETPWSEVGTEAVKNIPSSAMKLAKDIYQTVRHPIETGKAVGGLAVGTAQKLIPGEQAQEKYADAVGEFIMDRYGSEEAFKQTVATDPVGALTDLASIFTGAGGALKLTGKAAQMGKVAKAGEIATKIGAAAEPLNIVAKGGVGLLKLVPESVPIGIYERVAKIPPTKFKNPKDRIQAVKTALDEGIPPTQKGVDTLWEKVNVIEGKVDAIIKTNPNEPIPTGDIIRVLDEVRKDWADDPFAKGFLDEIDQLEVDFLQDKGPTISATDAQKMKKRAYKTIRKAYGKELTSVGEDARMAVANSTLTELKTLFPELKELGIQEGKLLDLHKAIYNAVGRIENHNMLSLTALMAGGTMGVASQSAGAGIGAAVLARILTHPKVQSQLALQLRKAKKANIGSVVAEGQITGKLKKGLVGTKARLAAAQAGRGE